MVIDGWPDAELVLDARARLGEGPVWDDRAGVLVWVDILAPAVHVYRPADGSDVVLPVPRPVGAVALRDVGGPAAGPRGWVLAPRARTDRCGFSRQWRPATRRPG